MQCCDEGPQKWEDKTIPETPVRTYILPRALRDAGVTITSITSVASSVYKLSEVPDPSPATILANVNGTNTSAITTDDGDVVAVGAAVLVKFAAAGVIGCTYVIRLTLKLSTGEDFVEDVLQRITEYVPSGC